MVNKPINQQQWEYDDICLVGGLEHEFYFPFHIWDVIRNPLTNSIIFQDGEIAPPTSTYSEFKAGGPPESFF